MTFTDQIDINVLILFTWTLISDSNHKIWPNDNFSSLNPFYLDIDFGQIKNTQIEASKAVLILFTWTLISDKKNVLFIPNNIKS